MVLEYMDHDLSGILGHPNFTFQPSHAKSLVKQMLEGLAYLHHMGILHRDIKGSNLLINNKGELKIADFGLSKIVWDKQTMTPCGTVGYTAPEIVRDERYSKSVDMWALGCVLYTMLCGFPPFYDESIDTLTEKVAKGQYTFLSPWWDHISDDAKDLVKHLLEINPKKRYTINQFLAHPWLHRWVT